MKIILLSLMAALAVNIAYGQVKATSAELNAGLDDAKFATSLALQGSKYLDQSGAKLYAITAAGANTYMAAIAPAITAYNAGQVFFIKITTSNTGASTLNLNSLGSKALVKDAATALASGDLLADRIYAVVYDGTNFQVMNAADTLKANLASPTFTGIPTAPTAAAEANTTQLATTAFVNTAIHALSVVSWNKFLDANVIGAAGLFPNIHTNGSTNYPSSTGGGLRFIRFNGSAVGYFEFNKPANASDVLKFRVGTGASTFSDWQNVASREWATDRFQPLLSPLGSGLTMTSAGTLYSGHETGANGSDLKVLKVSNPPGGLFKGAPTTVGAIKIQLPSNASVMYAIKGTLFQYDATNNNNRSTEFLITCYGSNMANAYSATFMGNNAPNYPVRWYTDGTTPAIYIGDLTSSWRYVAVSIDEVQASFRAATVGLASTGWSVSLDTAFTGTLSATQLNTLPFSNLNQPLAGFAAGADNALSASDTQIAAFGKLQGQLNAVKGLTATAAGANLVYAGPATGTAAPTLRRLQRSDLTNAFGAGVTTGVLDWNEVTNTQPGSGPTLLRGNATNGFGSATYYHPFTFEYSTKTGVGNITQLAYPYSPDVGDGIQYRTRHSGTYSAWRKVWDSSNLTNLNQLATRNFGDLQSKPTTLAGFGITDGATSASVTSVQASVTTLDGNSVHKTGTETITGTKFFNGGMGIGLAVSTVPSAYKLAVGGGIIAESVKVKPQGEWPDYVFEKDYPMLSLRELETFIIRNKHLPDVPVAAEVKKEGVDLGEMDSKLLKKIEELTLYIIEKDKEVIRLSEAFEKLKQEVEAIKKR